MLEPSKNRANDEGKCWKRRTSLEKKLISFFVLVSILALVFIVLYYTKRSCAVSQQECTDKNCVKAAAELLEFVDLKKDPCKEFYHYVCGHYIKDAVRNDASTPILQINALYQNELKSLIVDPIRKKDQSAGIAMKKFYQACMNESKIDADEDRTFMETINELGGWPLVNGTNWERANFDWIEWHLKSVKLGVPVIGLFSFRPADSADNITVLRVSGSSLSGISTTRSEFEFLMKDIAKLFNASDGYGTEIIEVYDFMRRVKKLSEEVAEEADEDEDVSTIADLYEKCPQFPWLKYINGLSEGVREFNNDTKIVVGEMETYCEEIDKLLKATSSQVIADYYIWSIIQNSHYLMSSSIRDRFVEMKSEGGDRFKVCYELTDERFKHLKETIYIRWKTNPHVKEQLEELVDITKEVFIEHVKKSTWMDEETKQRGIEKTQLIEKVVGAEDLLYDVEKFDKILGFDGLKFSSDNAFQILKEKNIKENEHSWYLMYENTPDDWEAYFKIAGEVNAFFAQSLNLMIVPAPILNSVFFNYKMPAYMNYGAIGRVIGHEFMHGFGEEGRVVLLENDETVDWWTNATADSFQKAKQCAIKEYEMVPFRYKLNGTITLEENMADMVGIDVAYEAYKRWVKKHGPEKKLPGIPLTPEQIFWIKTGMFLCFRKLDDENTDLEAKDVHAIPSFRVAAGARNSRYFAKDFNCPEGSFMNPKEKCQIL